MAVRTNVYLTKEIRDQLDKLPRIFNLSDFVRTKLTEYLEELEKEKTKNVSNN